MPPKWEVYYPDVPRPDYRRTTQPRPPDLLSCVYFLWRGEECVYVGQTRNLKKRLTHHRKFLPGDRITWLYFPPHELLRAEGFYIWLLHPRRNYRHIVNPKDPEEPRPYPLKFERATFQR